MGTAEECVFSSLVDAHAIPEYGYHVRDIHLDARLNLFTLHLTKPDQRNSDWELCVPMDQFLESVSTGSLVEPVRRNLQDLG